MQRITSREGPSAARTGFSVLGSERTATTSFPPARPGVLSVTMRSSRVAPANPSAQSAQHNNSMPAATRGNLGTLLIRDFLTEIGRLLQRYGFQAFLQSIGSRVVGEKQRNEEQRRQEHPPIRSQDVILLQ